MTKPDEPVLYYLLDGPPRGFVREELLVVPLDTQLPPDGVLKIRTESNRGKRNACLTAMSQKLMCDKEITILQIATNYSKLRTRDLAGNSTYIPGWLGWAMVLCSFQCQGVLLLLHIVGQGPAVLAAGAGRVGYIFYIFHLSSISNVLSFGRRLNMTEIL